MRRVGVFKTEKTLISVCRKQSIIRVKAAVGT